MANWVQTARDWARRGIASPKFAAKLCARRDTLFDASLADGGLDKPISASKNGVSMQLESGGRTLSIQDEMAALQRACEWIDQGAVPSQSKQWGRF